MEGESAQGQEVGVGGEVETEPGVQELQGDRCDDFVLRPSQGADRVDQGGTSCSSSIAPTSCSSRSSRVTRPATPPYSSSTIAIWIRRERNSSSNSRAFLVSGTQ